MSLKLDETEIYPFISLTLGLTFKLDETETNPHGTHSLTLKLDELETNPHVTQSHTSLMRLRQIHMPWHSHTRLMRFRLTHMLIAHKFDEVLTNLEIMSTHHLYIVSLVRFSPKTSQFSFFVCLIAKFVLCLFVTC